MSDRMLEELWETAPAAQEAFDPDAVSELPEPARRYLRHAIAPGARLSRAVRLQMHGEIRLGKDWLPFTAEQVLRWDRGFVWKARVKKGLVSVVGSDRWIDGEGAMRWKMLGIVPFLRAEGPDVSRSAAGRLQIESILLPAVLLDPGVRWSARADGGADALVAAHGEESHLEIAITEDGALRSARIARWGNPEGGDFLYTDFGGEMLGEGTFDGFTLPTRLRIGWFFGSDRFERDGDFFHATIDHATFR